MSANDLAAVAPLAAERFEITATDARALALSGEIAVRDPVAEFGPHFRRIHDAAVGGAEVFVDVTGLRFVNSSGLRLFLDWVAWIAAEPAERRYPLRFRTRKGATWQAAAFPAIVMLGAGNVTSEAG